MLDTNDSSNVLSLSEVADRIQFALRRGLPDGFWVRAEIHKLNLYPQSGHCYPDLVEKTENKVKAQMRATIWAGDFQRINIKFKSLAKRPLGDNLVVLFWARIQFHPVFGLSLNILDIDPTYTLGIMEREKAECITRLRNEGLFNLNKDLQLPLVPARLAIISVSTSKGFHDFLGILNTQGHRFKIQHELFPALLQGDKAISSIAKALNAINFEAHRYDSVAILRGGGGDVGLDCYNHYELAKLIAQFPLPILTGIGHSTNETVTEMVANQNLLTPTDLAYFLIRQFEDFEERLLHAGSFIIDGIPEQLLFEVGHLQSLCQSIQSHTRIMLKHGVETLNVYARKLGREWPIVINRQEQRIQFAASALRVSPARAYRTNELVFEKLTNQLSLACKRFIGTQTTRVENLERNMNLLDPTHVLQRGYSITRAEGKALTSAKHVKAGQTIHTQLSEGTLISKVEKSKQH